jgi:RES domain-containing protein
MVAPLLRPWSGVGFRHIPAGSPFGVLDTRFAGRSTDNRWNDAGDPTLYVAGDRAVAIAEFARHLQERFSATAAAMLIERAMYRLDLRLRAVLDLRDPHARTALGQPHDVYQFLDIAYARATANFVRRTTAAEALFVPSMAFLDDTSRWNLVLFLEKLPADLTSFITPVADGVFRLERV